MTQRVLLYSGGLDSAALRLLWRPDLCLYVDLHTWYAAAERTRLDPEVQVLDFPGLQRFERSTDFLLPLRNLFLVALAAQFGNEIALGATAGDRILDQSEGFAQRASELLTYLWSPQLWTEGREIRVVLPARSYTKAALVREYIAAGGDPEELARKSYSCYSPQGPCGGCKPCYRKWVAFRVNGVRIQPSSRVVLQREVVPQILAGVYGRGEAEEQEILRAVAFED